jgi:hemolysin activation/secretion protein
MKDFLVRLLLALAVTLGALLLASPVSAQQADEDAPPATANRQQPTTKPESPQHDAQLPSPDDTQTPASLAFTGSVIKEKGRIVLKDPVTKMSYQFAEQPKAKQYLGRQVKVIGQLDVSSNTIHIDSIEPIM